MESKQRIFILAIFITVIFALIAVLLFLPTNPSQEKTSSTELMVSTHVRTSSPTLQTEVDTTNIWFSLQAQTPVPHTTPLPDSEWTPIDGTYAKLDPSLPQWWACRRCADYRPAGGIWKLQFDKGVMRIYYPITGWRSVASYIVSGDRLFIFKIHTAHRRSGNSPGNWKICGTWLTEALKLKSSLILVLSN
jgi:hypothetical protein